MPISLRRTVARLTAAAVIAGITTTATLVTSSPEGSLPAASAAYAGSGFTLMPSLTASARAHPTYVIKLTDATLAGKRSLFAAAARQINGNTRLRVKVAPGTHSGAALSDNQGVIVVRSVTALLNPANGAAIDGYAGIKNGTPTDQVVDSGQFMQLDTEIWSKTDAYQRSIVAHELGHALGLDHDPSTASLMHATVDSTDAGTYKAGDLRGFTHLGQNLPNCADILLVGARGSGEGNHTAGPDFGPDPGYGPTVGAAVGAVMTALQSPDKTFAIREVAVPWVAEPVALERLIGVLTDDTSYWESVRNGENALRPILDKSAIECPGTRTILVGYSQGAHVVGNVLEARTPANSLPALSAAAAARVSAVALFADPTYVGSHAYARGSAAGWKYDIDPAGTIRMGIFPRLPHTLSSFSGRLLSWCADGDMACTANLGGKDVHVNYYVNNAEYREAASIHIDQKAGNEVFTVPAEPTRTRTFSAYATSTLTRSSTDITLEVCDPQRAGQRVYAQLSRSGGSFAVVDQLLSASGCATFLNLDGAGSPLATPYTTRVGLNQYPSPSWAAAGCNATTGGQGLCDTQSATFSSASVSNPSWTVDEIRHSVCDPQRVGHTVRLQLSRVGKTFPVVSKVIPSTGCAVFANLDGEGPVNRDTTYTLRAALNQDPSPAWPASRCYAATGGMGLCDPITTTGFSAAATSTDSWTVDEIRHSVCDPNRAGQTVRLQLSRPGKTFPVVSKVIPSTSTGCAVFSNLDGDGPVLTNTTYSLRAALNQDPNPAWPASSCYQSSGGLGLCDQLTTGTGATSATFQLPFRCNETWVASNYSGHGYGEIDFNRNGDDGMPVVASASGTVHLYRLQATGGHVLWLKHPNGWFTVYGHLKYAPAVSVGQSVAQGQVIGYVGATGRTSGPHLHYAQQDRLDHSVRATFDRVPSPVHNESDAPATITSRNSC